MSTPRGAPLRVGGVRWWLREGAEPEQARALLEHALAALEAREAAPGAEGEPPWIELRLGAQEHRLAWRRYDGGAGALRRLGSSHARRALARARDAARRELPALLPFAAGERRRRGLLERGFLLAALPPGARDLEGLWRERSGGAPRRAALAQELGALLRRLHDAGVALEAASPRQFLLLRGEPPALVLAGLEDVRLGARLGERARRASLTRLERGFADAGLVDRFRFLRAYSKGRRRETRRRWRALEHALPRAFERALRAGARELARGSAQFPRVRVGAWQGVASRELAVARLAALARAAGPAPRAGAPPLAEAFEGAWRLRYAGLAPAAAGRLWAAARALTAGAGLGPAPLALLQRGEEALLLLARPEGAVRLRPEHDGDRGRRAAEALLLALAVVGEPAEGLTAACVVLVPGPGGALRAALLDPGGLRPARRPAAERRRAARALARALLALPAPAEAPPGA